MCDIDAFHALIDIKRTYGGVALGSIVVPAYYYDGYACILQLLKALFEGVERPDPGPHVVEDIASMDYCIWLKLNDPIHCLVETVVDHLLYQVSAVLINAAVVREAKVRVGHVDYLQALSLNLKSV